LINTTWGWATVEAGGAEGCTTNEVVGLISDKIGSGCDKACTVVAGVVDTVHADTMDVQSAKAGPVGLGLCSCISQVGWGTASVHSVIDVTGPGMGCSDIGGVHSCTGMAG